jgi:hypothetical protein
MILFAHVGPVPVEEFFGAAPGLLASVTLVAHVVRSRVQRRGRSPKS